LPKFNVGEAVSIAKTLRMSEAGLGKIDTEDRTVRVIKGDSEALGRSRNRRIICAGLAEAGPQATTECRKFGSHVSGPHFLRNCSASSIGGG